MYSYSFHLHFLCSACMQYFLSLHSVKINLDGPNSVPSSAQTNQKDFSEDYPSSAERHDSCVEQLLPGITSPAPPSIPEGRRELVKSQPVTYHYIILFASYLNSHNVPLQWAYGIVIIYSSPLFRNVSFAFPSKSAESELPRI